MCYKKGTKLKIDTSKLLSKLLLDPSHTRLNDIIYIIFLNLIIYTINVLRKIIKDFLKKTKSD